MAEHHSFPLDGIRKQYPLILTCCITELGKFIKTIPNHIVHYQNPYFIVQKFTDVFV